MPQSARDTRGHDAPQARSRIGFIGLGAMGSRIAGRLLDAGHPVSATNRTAAKAQPLIERGLAWLGTAREVAASTDIVLSMVTDTRPSRRSRPARTACSPASAPDRSTST